MNLLYMCIFYEKNYILLLKMLLQSLYNCNDTSLFTILIYTSSIFKTKIIDECKTDNIIFIINDTITTKLEACLSRLDIFDVIKNITCTTILYIDIDVLIQNPLSIIFDKCKDNKLYALKEGTINHTYYGKELFQKSIDEFDDISGFSSGVLLFKNCVEIKILFEDIKRHIEYSNKNNILFYDQPYFNFHGKINYIVDNTTLHHDVVTNLIEYNNKYTIIHFCGNVNVNVEKHLLMKSYYDNLLSLGIYTK